MAFVQSLTLKLELRVWSKLEFGVAVWSLEFGVWSCGLEFGVWSLERSFGVSREVLEFAEKFWSLERSFGV